MNIKDFLKWRPIDIPAVPNVVYKNKGWVSYEKFFGTRRGKIVMPYSDAVRAVREAGINTRNKFHSWKRPPTMPSGSHAVQRVPRLEHVSRKDGTDQLKELATYSDALTSSTGAIHSNLHLSRKFFRLEIIVFAASFTRFFLSCSAFKHRSFWCDLYANCSQPL